MKKYFVLLSVFFLALSGCLVKSLHPFYHEKDVVFNENINGTWMDGDSSLWIFRQFSTSVFLGPDKPDNSYLLKIASDQEDTAFFNVHLFNLKNKFYLDFYPLLEDNIGDDFASFHFIQSHSIARIEIFSVQNMAFFWYDQEWINDLFEQRKVRISHEVVNDNIYVLTAKTDELQKFIVKYGREADVFEKFNPDVYNVRNDASEYQEIIENEMDRFSGSEILGGNDIIYSNLIKISPVSR